jgi:hypothetical protein
VNLVNFVNFGADLWREPLIFSLFLCSHQKLIERKGNDVLGRFRAPPELIPEDVHYVHEVHAREGGSFGTGGTRRPG